MKNSRVVPMHSAHRELKRMRRDVPRLSRRYAKMNLKPEQRAAADQSIEAQRIILENIQTRLAAKQALEA